MAAVACAADEAAGGMGKAMEITYGNIRLRDMCSTDIEDYVRWFTTQTEWLDWDEPWDPVNTDAEQERARWSRCYAEMRALPADAPRRRLEIETEGRHIGCVIAYPVNARGEWTPREQAALEQILYPAIGIDLCEPGFSGCGLGTQALQAFVQYLARLGCHTLYLTTWSGNLRMMRLAQKLGFALCLRTPGCHIVRGKAYDELVYRRTEQGI